MRRVAKIVKVTFFHRKPRATGNFSIELIFDSLRKRLADAINAQVHVAPYFSNGILRRIAIAVDARRHQGQINHVTGDINFAALLLDRRRTILTSHDCGYLVGKRGLKRRLLKWLWLEMPVKRARFVTTVSEEAKRDLLSHVHCDPAKVVVIYNPVADTFVYQPRTFNSANPRILQVGTAPNKNIQRLAQALEGVDCTLIIIGPIDTMLSKLLQRCRVRYEKFVNCSGAEMAEQYALADLVAVVSTLEGFGLPILEANAVGRPVVTSNTSSMPEVAGDAACFVDPFDVTSIRNGILRVIGDAEFRNKLIQNGLCNVRRFQTEVIARQYLELYQRVACEVNAGDATHTTRSEKSVLIDIECET